MLYSPVTKIGDQNGDVEDNGMFGKRHQLCDENRPWDCSKAILEKESYSFYWIITQCLLSQSGLTPLRTDATGKLTFPSAVSSVLQPDLASIDNPRGRRSNPHCLLFTADLSLALTATLHPDSRNSLLACRSFPLLVSPWNSPTADFRHDTSIICTACKVQVYFQGMKRLLDSDRMETDDENFTTRQYQEERLVSVSRGLRTDVISASRPMWRLMS
ncbi:hypothetical protein J6590_046724 [Homalodisca vitripennis]|nr:hypothetical protein J6590_046724 [Homalodisca vitripennis]